MRYWIYKERERETYIYIFFFYFCKFVYIYLFIFIKHRVLHASLQPFPEREISAFPAVFTAAAMRMLIDSCARGLGSW